MKRLETESKMARSLSSPSPAEFSFSKLAISPVEKVEVVASVKAFSANSIVSPFVLMTPARMDEAANSPESVLPEATVRDVVAPEDGP